MFFLDGTYMVYFRGRGVFKIHLSTLVAFQSSEHVDGFVGNLQLFGRPGLCCSFPITIVVPGMWLVLDKYLLTPTMFVEVTECVGLQLGALCRCCWEWKTWCSAALLFELYKHLFLCEAETQKPKFQQKQTF